MATLEQELLADFEHSGSESEPDNTSDADMRDLERDLEGGLGTGEAGNEETDEGEEDGATAVRAPKHEAPADGRGAAALVSRLEPMLEKIDFYREHPEETASTGGPIEGNPEYQLLTQANTLSTDIDSEILVVHKYIRDHYNDRFPNLEGLVKNPIEYAKTVAILGNAPMENTKAADNADNMIGMPLARILDGPSLMVVTMEATRGEGRELSKTELERVRNGCAMQLKLDNGRVVLVRYVESRTAKFAPNLTELVGPRVAAQFLNFRGGISGLVKTPASNIAAIGARPTTATGFATNVGGVRLQGAICDSELIRGVRPEVHRQALRILSAKVVLVARVDMVHQNPDGSFGRKMHEEVARKLDKLTEPPPNKGVRALAVPDDKLSRKRGGRRARKAKEATAMTDMRKAQNRMAFGKEEKEVGYGDTTKGLGMVGSADSGQLRNLQIDSRTRAKLSKKNPGWGATGTATALGGTASSLGFGQSSGSATVLRGHGLHVPGSGAPTGTSSIAFTPVQGLELVDPAAREDMRRKQSAEQDKWFRGGTFTHIPNASAGDQSTGRAQPGSQSGSTPAAKADAASTPGKAASEAGTTAAVGAHMSGNTVAGKKRAAMDADLMPPPPVPKKARVDAAPAASDDKHSGDANGSGDNGHGGSAN